MKLNDYVHNMYESNIEMTSLISAEQPEFEENLKKDIDISFRNIFPKTANLKGIEAWEKLLKIELDSNSDNLEYRRNRVITKLSTTAPLSYRWLEENLKNLLGKNNFYINSAYNESVLNINVSDLFNDTAQTLFKLYRPLIPANLELFINLFEEETANLYIGIVVQIADKMLIQSEVI